MKVGKIKKITAIGLALVMSVGLIYSSNIVSAVGSTKQEDNGVVTTKTAEWNDQTKTAEITLESYATGNVTAGEAKPLDIVLVLDQSGSMYNSNSYKTLQKSVENFVGKIQESAKKNNVDHRVAIAGFASNGEPGSSSGIISEGSSKNYYTNTGLFINGYLKNYKSYRKIYLSQMDINKKYYIEDWLGYREISYNGSSWGYRRGFSWRSVAVKQYENDGNTQAYELSGLTSTDYQNALVSANIGGSVNNNLTQAISRIAAYGATYTSFGMEMAKNVFANNPIDKDSNRERVVILFTDGEPGRSGFEDSEADNAIDEAYEIKNTYNAEVYSIGFYKNQIDNDVTNFMNYVSSNYPNAQSMDNHGKKQNSNYYYKASNADDMYDIFDRISDNIISGVNLNGEAYMYDKISDSFQMPKNTEINTDNSDILIYTSEYNGKDENGEMKWLDPKPFKANVEINNSDKSIKVSGFNYKENYVLDKNPDNEGKPSGKKLIIKIKVKPIDGFIGGNGVFTNKAGSGLFDKDNTLVEEFDKPNVDIPLNYTALKNDATIHMGNEWKEFKDFITSSSMNYHQGDINKTYKVDGIVNKYVDIVYEIKQGDTVIATLNIPHEKNIDDCQFVFKDGYTTSSLENCINYTIDVQINPSNKGEYTSINNNLNSWLHVLKPNISIHDSTMDYGTKHDLQDNIGNNGASSVNWTDDNHTEIPDASDTEPTLNYTFKGVSDFNKLENSIFTPQKPKDGKFELIVKNTNGTEYKNVVKNGMNPTNKFTVYVRSGSLDIDKLIEGGYSKADGDPIFTYKVTIENELLGNKSYYAYIRIPEKNSANLDKLTGLPVGNWKIEELDTLRFECKGAKATLPNKAPILSNNKEISFGVDSFGENLTNYKVEYTNKQKSSEKDSDNDIVVNTFKRGENGKVEIGKEYMDGRK